MLSKQPLPDGWAWGTVGDVANFLDNLRIPVNAVERAKRIAGKSTSTLYPYYGANGQVGWIDGYLFDQDLVLLAEDGGYFGDKNKSIAYRIKGKSWVNNHAHILKPKPGIEIGYLQFVLNYCNIMPYVRGTTRLKLNQSDAKKILIPLPPTCEQKRMVAKIEALLAENKTAQENLDKIPILLRKCQKSVLNLAFRGKLTEYKLTDEPLDILLKKICNDQNAIPDYEKIGNVNLYKLPEKWAWIKLGNLIDSFKNGLYKPIKFYGKGIPCLRMYNIAEGKINLNNVREMILSEDEVDDYCLLENDILLNRINSRELVGKAAVVPNGLGRVVFEAMTVRLRVKKNVIKPKYITYFLQTNFARSQIEIKAKQTVGMATVSQEDVKTWYIPYCSVEEQERIIEKIESVFSLSEQTNLAVEYAKKKANKISQSVLTKAFRGELVPQDPNDEPASVLLQRIKSGRS